MRIVFGIGHSADGKRNASRGTVPMLGPFAATLFAVTVTSQDINGPCDAVESRRGAVLHVHCKRHIGGNPTVRGSQPIHELNYGLMSPLARVRWIQE